MYKIPRCEYQKQHQCGWGLPQYWRNEEEDEQEETNKQYGQQQRQRPQRLRTQQRGWGQQLCWTNEEENKQEEMNKQRGQKQRQRQQQQRGRQQNQDQRQQKWKNEEEDEQENKSMGMGSGMRGGMRGGRRGNTNKNTNWNETMDMQGTQSNKVKAEWNKDLNALIVTVPRMCQPWESVHESNKINKMKRIVPLPKNVDLTQLRVRMNMRDNVLDMSAPYKRCTLRHGMMSKRRPYTTDMLGKWQNISTSGMRHHGEMQTLDDTMFSNTSGRNKCMMPSMLGDCSCFMQQQQQDTMKKKMLTTKVVKDNKTGKWKVLIEVMVSGFRRDEVKVNFQENEGVLVVEAKKDKRQMNSQQQQKICLKQLREEIVVPEGCDGNEMRFQMKENGILRIELPCTRKPTGMNMGEESDDEQSDEEKSESSSEEEQDEKTL